MEKSRQKRNIVLLTAENIKKREKEIIRKSNTDHALVDTVESSIKSNEILRYLSYSLPSTFSNEIDLTADYGNKNIPDLTHLQESRSLVNKTVSDNEFKMKVDDINTTQSIDNEETITNCDTRSFDNKEATLENQSNISAVNFMETPQGDESEKLADNHLNNVQHSSSSKDSDRFIIPSPCNDLLCSSKKKRRKIFPVKSKRSKLNIYSFFFNLFRNKSGTHFFLK